LHFSLELIFYFNDVIIVIFVAIVIINYYFIINPAGRCRRFRWKGSSSSAMFWKRGFRRRPRWPVWWGCRVGRRAGGYDMEWMIPRSMLDVVNGSIFRTVGLVTPFFSTAR
jgi:hypothetical protein